MSWDTALARDMARRTISKWGKGPWALYLSEDQQEAQLCQEIVSVLLSQDDSSPATILEVKALIKEVFKSAEKGWKA